MKKDLLLSIDGIAAKILFCEERTKKIAANSPIQMFIKASQFILLKLQMRYRQATVY
jgi:hypothetical protein